MRRLAFTLAAALLTVSGCVTPTAVAPPVPGMVSAADPRAAAAGAEMLRAGGSAADAAIATLLALTVVEPQSSGIGGGGFLVYEDGDGTPQTYDGRETAPMAATGTWFFKNGRPMAQAEAVPGGKSVGVPGSLRLMALAHRDHGRLPWAKLFDPAIRLARDGFVVTPRLRRALVNYKPKAAFSAEGRALFFGGGDDPVPAGNLIRNSALASFLQSMAVAGADSFYVGPNARSIAASVNGAPVNPSQVALGDLAAYQAKQRPPVCGRYRAYRICGMGPPSSGGTTVLVILKQLERFDLRALGPKSVTAWHLFIESTRLAFADRNRYLADPDFVKVPLAGLTDEAYLAQRSALIAPDRTIAKVTAGDPPGATRVAAGLEPMEQGTSHFVAADKWGEVASLTSTIEGAWGSGLVVNGYYLNNELTDFSLVPDMNGVPVANRVEPGKRPRSSMSPTIVYGPDGKVRLAVGAAGDATIIAQVARAIIGVVDWDLSAQQAIAMPMIHAPADAVFVERGTYLEALIPQLRALGHSRIGHHAPTTYKANAIEWSGGRWVGAADPRSEGAAVSE